MDDRHKSWLVGAKDLHVLILTFAIVIRFDSCTELLLNCNFDRLFDQARVCRVGFWD